MPKKAPPPTVDIELDNVEATENGTAVVAENPLLPYVSDIANTKHCPLRKKNLPKLNEDPVRLLKVLEETYQLVLERDDLPLKHNGAFHLYIDGLSVYQLEAIDWLQKAYRVIVEQVVAAYDASENPPAYLNDFLQHVRIDQFPNPLLRHHTNRFQQQVQQHPHEEKAVFKLLLKLPDIVEYQTNPLLQFLGDSRNGDGTCPVDNHLYPELIELLMHNSNNLTQNIAFLDEAYQTITTNTDQLYTSSKNRPQSKLQKNHLHMLRQAYLHLASSSLDKLTGLDREEVRNLIRADNSEIARAVADHHHAELYNRLLDPGISAFHCRTANGFLSLPF